MTNPHVLAVNTDSALSQAFTDRDVVLHRIANAKDAVRKAAGQSHDYHQGFWTWSGTWAEALAFTPAEDYQERLYTKATAELAGWEEELAVLDAEIAKLNAQYTGWSRFFLVTNTNGHIHSSLNCSTCYPTTTYAWLFTLSGLTEAEAVEDQGEILCSICFPSAPVEWTNGVAKATQVERDARAAAKAERQAKKAAKALYPEDPEKALRVETESSFPERIYTIHAAKAWLTNAAETNGWYPRTDYEGNTSYHHPSYPPEAVELVSTVLAERLGTTPATELAAAAKRAAKRS